MGVQKINTKVKSIDIKVSDFIEFDAYTFKKIN
jgi:hypothetical protein